MSQISLGVDPGVRNCGLAVVEKDNGKLTLLRHRTIVTTGTNLVNQLIQVGRAVGQMIEEYNPDVVVVEDALWYGVKRKGLLDLPKCVWAVVAYSEGGGIRARLVPAGAKSKVKIPPNLVPKKNGWTEHT